MVYPNCKHAVLQKEFLSIFNSRPILLISPLKHLRPLIRTALMKICLTPEMSGKTSYSLVNKFNISNTVPTLFKIRWGLGNDSEMFLSSQQKNLYNEGLQHKA